MKHVIRFLLVVILLAAVAGGGYWFYQNRRRDEERAGERRLHAGGAGAAGQSELDRQRGRAVGGRAERRPGLRPHQRDDQAAQPGGETGQHRDGHPGAGDHRPGALPAGARPGQERSPGRREDPGRPQDSADRPADRPGRPRHRKGRGAAPAGKIRPGEPGLVGPRQPPQCRPGCEGQSGPDPTPGDPGGARCHRKDGARSALQRAVVATPCEQLQELEREHEANLEQMLEREKGQACCPGWSPTWRASAPSGSALPPGHGG